MADERITANEWDKGKQCPVCIDIAERKIPPDGEIMIHDSTGKPIPCPICEYNETRMFHDIGGVESKRSSTRGDTQVWNHLIRVECLSCGWKHVVDNMICLGNPWEEVFGFNRHLEQSDSQQHALTWSNEQAVGLRGGLDKYNPDDELLGKGHRAEREITTEKTEGLGQVEWIPTEEERKLPKFKDSDKS